MAKEPLKKKEVKEDPINVIVEENKALNIRISLLEHKVDQIDNVIKLALSRLGLQQEYK